MALHHVLNGLCLVMEFVDDCDMCVRAVLVVMSRVLMVSVAGVKVSVRGA